MEVKKQDLHAPKTHVDRVSGAEFTWHVVASGQIQLILLRHVPHVQLTATNMTPIYCSTHQHLQSESRHSLMILERITCSTLFG